MARSRQTGSAQIALWVRGDVTVEMSMREIVQGLQG